MEQNKRTMEMKGKKYDQEKNRVDLVDPEYVLGIGKVLTFGANKYGDNTWQELKNGKERYYGALLRHLLAWKQGETTDKESGLKSLHHVATNAMFLSWIEKNEEI